MQFNDNLAHRTARGMAYLGGMILFGLIVVTCLSILGRSFNTLGNMPELLKFWPSFAQMLQKFSPVAGDFELMEMGIAVAIFLFLPLCQLRLAHAKVDVFTNRFFSVRTNIILSVIWEVIFSAILAVITLQLYRGMRDKMLYQEVTFLLQWPVWWAFGACFFASCIATFVAFYSVYERAQVLGSKAQ